MPLERSLRMPSEISPQDLEKWIGTGRPFTLIDVRELWEREHCLIQNSIHIPMGDLENHVRTFSSNETYVLYCHHGRRSMRMCCFLHELGFENVFNLKGGIHAWSEQVDHRVPVY